MPAGAAKCYPARVKVRPVSLLLLAVLLMPLWVELVENGVHLVEHGDVAHAAQGPGHEQAPSPEHGCSEFFHFCSCCRTAAAEGAVMAGVPAPEPLLNDLVSGLPESTSSELARSLYHPPRA